MSITFLQVLHEAEITALVAVVGYILMFPIKSIFHTVRGKAALLEDVHAELVKQRTNCLSTLQQQGKTQIEVLERVAGTLQDMHESQIEANTILRGLQK